MANGLGPLRADGGGFSVAAQTGAAAAVGGVRQPVCQVLLNGASSLALAGLALPVSTNMSVPLTGVLEAEVINNNYYSADTFRVVLALKQAPPWFDIDMLSTQSIIPLEIIMGPNPNDTLSLIKGVVDDFDYDPLDDTVELRGRDYTRYFIDTKSTQKWTNQTASQIAAVLAQGHGLDTSLITPTTQGIGGAVYDYQSKVGDGRTEWDVLTWLTGQTVDADGNSFVVYVTGNSLYFGPRPTEVDYAITLKRATTPDGRFYMPPAQEQAIPGPLVGLMPVQGPAWGGISIKLSRNISVLRNVVVQMLSAQTSRHVTLTATWPDVPVTSDMQLYSFKMSPDIPQDSLQQQARARQQDISRHELRLSFTLPGDSVLKQSSMLQVRGLGKAFGQSYFVQSVTRHFSPGRGYVMEGVAQNRALVDGA